MKLMFALVLTCSLFGLHASETCNSARNPHWCSFQQADINTLECMDGHLCRVDDSNHQDGSWACCKDHGGRSKCPSNHPNMCNSKKCGGGTAYCCEVDCAGKIEEGGFGGNRPCPCIVTDQDDKIQCADGSFCLGDSSDYGSESWQCCNEKGGRVGCPPNHPNLCAAENACGNGTTLCCEKDCGDLDGKLFEKFGGKLPCACSEIASGLWLKDVCCDGLKSGGTVVQQYTTIDFYTYESCDDYVNNGEYVKDACPKTCAE